MRHGLAALAVALLAGAAAAPAEAVSRSTKRLVAAGEISPTLVARPSSWLDRREAFIRDAVKRHAALAPALPVTYRLDRDFVTAARERRSIAVVDDCGAALCGVATDELHGDWNTADLRALFTPADAPRALRDAFAAALAGTFEGEDVDRWAADELRAGLFARYRDLDVATSDARLFVPAVASLMRSLDAKQTMPFAAMRARLARLAAGDEQRWLAHLRALAPAPAPHAPATRVHGATFSVVNRIERSPLADGSRVELRRLRDLGYDTIALLPFAMQRDAAANELRPLDTMPAGETDLAMRLAAVRAHALGMRVVLKPQVWVHGSDPTHIEPADPRAWWTSYERFLLHDALLARALGAEWLVVGTELTRTEARPEWRALIAKLRALFHGRLTYAANFDAFERTPFWDALDAVGVDAYFPLSTSASATDADLRRGAASVVARLDAVATRARKPLLLTEVGYPSVAAPWIQPWREARDAPANPHDQSRAFAAILDALAKSRTALGFVIWKYETDPDRRDDTGYLPKGKEAERTIAKYLRW